MNLIQLRTRELGECYIIVFAIESPVNILYEGKVCTRKMYTLIGVDIEGKKDIYITV